jgi:hypothetical protein
MMAILSENRKKEYPKSVTELLRLEKKRFVQGISYFINKIPIFIFENRKNEYRKSVTELLKLEGKRFVQGVCYFINKIPKFI